jgi:hypothetical protein
MLVMAPRLRLDHEQVYADRRVDAKATAAAKLASLMLRMSELASSPGTQQL